MADLRIPPPSTSPAQRPAAGARTEAVRNAQQAFFQAAMGRPAPPAQPQAAPVAASAPGKAPERLLRPGSLVDVKV